eukprot:TRINITY_DN5702_c1_g1_i8.p1 TRINITY_DN5702_c1_g1~~TRINITY_DN5702_c1_g1_i8.p1  ORF type:complete len:690 (+),score=86.07 TRINITY_DN5702_c1_g1_i8:41-2110(+)
MSNVRQKTPSRAYADDGLFREERAPRTARVAAAPSRTPQMRLSIGGRASRTARVAAAPSRTPQMRLSIGGRASRSNSRRPQSEKIRAGKLVTPLWRRDSSARLNPLINQRPCSKHVVTSSRLRTTPLPVTRSSPPPPILKRKRLPEDSQSRVPRLVGRTNNVATNREGKEHTISIHSKQPVRRVVVRKRIVRRGGVLKRPAGVGAVDRIHSNRQYGYAKPRKDMLPVDLPPREADPLHMQEEEQISSEEVGEMDLEEETSYVMSDEDICRDQHNEISEDVMAEGYRYQQREVEDVSSEENARREEERKEWDRGKAAPPAKPPRPMHVLPDEPERRSKSRRRRCQKILARPRVSARRELHSLARPRQMVPQRKRSNDAQTSSLRAGPSLLPSSRPPQLRCRVKRLSEKPRLSMSGTKQVTEHGSKHQVGAERKESWVRGAISQTKVSTRGADEMHAKHISPRAMVQLRTQRKAELKQPIGEKVVDIEKEEQMKVAANSRRTRVDAIRQHSYVKPRDGKRSVDLRHRRRESSNKQVEEQISYDEFEDMDVDGGTSDDDLARGFHNEVGEENSEEEVNSEEKGREQTENEELDDRKAAPPGKPPLRKPPVPTHVLTDEQEKRPQGVAAGILRQNGKSVQILSKRGGRVSPIALTEARNPRPVRPPLRVGRVVPSPPRQPQVNWQPRIKAVST